MKILLILIFTLLFALFINGQAIKPCNLGLANAPVLRGVKLGMSPIQVEKALNTKIILKDYKPFLTDEIIPEVKKFEYFGKSKDVKTPTQLEGIDALFLSFYNNSLYKIFVIYEKPVIAWKDKAEFASYITEKFDLPKDSFLQNTYLSCEGFSLSVGINDRGNTLLGLSNSKIGKLADAKESQLIEKYKPKRRMLEIEKEKGFKP
jgi:hypothetical protein